jgi:hypothetical protein
MEKFQLETELELQFFFIQGQILLESTTAFESQINKTTEVS